MNNILAFHKSVQGSNHIEWGRPCEDASGSYANPEKQYYLAAVSDGHGADECYRADKGSKIAVEIAIKDLQELAEKMTRTPEVEARFYQDMLSSPRYQQMTMRHLTDVIHAEWVESVRQDLQDHPPTEAELVSLQEKKKTNYTVSDRPEQVYGCTLMAALWMPKCLLLIHQGDGRCDVFYTDGTVDQPIPWDSRCVGTRTTSLCDDDVEPSFRNCVIDLQKKPVMACYLGCDGVEDAYRDSEENMEGVHTFYKGLTYEVVHRTPEQLNEYLEEMLPKFSYNGLYNNAGSGDDISVAAIVDVAAARPFAAAFLRDTQIYTLRESAFWKEDAVRSKIRKHGILQRRVSEAEDAAKNSTEKLERLREQRTDLADDIERAKIFIAKDRQDLEQLKLEKQSATSDVEQLRDGNVLQNVTFLRRLIAAGDAFMTELKDKYHTKEDELQRKERKLQELQQRLETLDASILELNQQQSDLEEKLNKQRRDFAEYDAQFRNAQDAAAQAKRALDMLLSAPPEDNDFPEVPPPAPVSEVAEEGTPVEELSFNTPVTETGEDFQSSEPSVEEQLGRIDGSSDSATSPPEIRSESEGFEIYFSALDSQDDF